MKTPLFICCLFFSLAVSGQLREVPTLESKGILGKATKVELSQYDFVQDKGLILAQSDIENYDDKGWLSSIERTVHSSGLVYRYKYTVDKKGLLEQEKIVNAANNETVRTTDYSWKKGLLVKTTQVQGTVTLEKTYTYNKDGYLTGVDAVENGSLKGAELYEIDAQGRRLKTSLKLPADTEAKTVSIFSYSTEGGQEKRTEIREVNNVSYKIVTVKDLLRNRDIEEQTTNQSNNQSGFKKLSYAEDEQGSWFKGEIIDNQFGRSRLVLRKITYADGTVTGRNEVIPEDHHARYFRRYTQFQVVLNGKVVQTTSAQNLEGTSDRLTYVSSSGCMVLLKGYDDKTNHTNWHEAEVVSHDKGEVVWLGKEDGVDVYLTGIKLTNGAYTSNLNSYEVGNTAVAYVAREIKKSFVARGFNSEANIGKVHLAQLSDDDLYWGKASDSTYVLVGYGSSIGLKKQNEDELGNKLVKNSAADYWYSLPEFRERFDNGKPGDIFPAVLLGDDPVKQIESEQLFAANFSSFKYDKLENRRYRLKTVDGTVVTNLAEASVKTPDDQLLTYFPLTNQYLRMDGYYTSPDGIEMSDQQVTPLLTGSKDGYYMYNDMKSIRFYVGGKLVGDHNFGAHRLNDDARQMGAVLYDSATTRSYGMVYDLATPHVMGPMNRLLTNQSAAYLLKLDGGRWVIFEKGVKVTSYDYSVLDGDDVIHFFKDPEKGTASAYSFAGFAQAAPGDFIGAFLLSKNNVKELSEKHNVDPLREESNH